MKTVFAPFFVLFFFVLFFVLASLCGILALYAGIVLVAMMELVIVLVAAIHGQIVRALRGLVASVRAR